METNTFIKNNWELLAALFLTCATFSYFYISGEKWNAKWGSFNVTVLSLIISPLVGLAMKKVFEHFVGEDFLFSWRGILILCVAAMSSIFLGVNYGDAQPTVQEEQYAKSDNGRQHRTNSYWLFQGNDSSSTDTEMDGEGLAVLILIIVVLAMVFLSAFIQHFWIMGALSIISIIVIMAVNNLEKQRFSIKS